MTTNTDAVLDAAAHGQCVHGHPLAWTLPDEDARIHGCCPTFDCDAPEVTMRVGSGVLDVAR